MAPRGAPPVGTQAGRPASARWWEATETLGPVMTSGWREAEPSLLDAVEDAAEAAAASSLALRARVRLRPPLRPLDRLLPDSLPPAVPSDSASSHPEAPSLRSFRPGEEVPAEPASKAALEVAGAGRAEDEGEAGAAALASRG